ncbi:unnamed protein product, partial [Polarella glacialis]
DTSCVCCRGQRGPPGWDCGRRDVIGTNRMRLGDPCAVDAIGPEACYKAVKSIMLASAYIQDSHPGMQIAFELQRVKAPARGSHPETVKA